MIYNTFEELEAQGEQLYQSEQYDAFIELYKIQMENFPEHLPEMIHDLALVYLTNGDKANALAFLSAGLERGYFFGLPEWGIFFQELGDDQEFIKLRKYNEKLKAIAQQSSQPQWAVILPDGYDPLGSYPLFISIHGYGENIRMLQRFWHAPILKEKFIHAYVQSSQKVDLTYFCWNDNDLARQEIIQMASVITDQYAVNLGQIYIGGFSQGGTLSADFAFSQAIPIQGFAALCPRRPDSVDPESLKNAHELGLKAVILTGEKEEMLDMHKDMIREFESAQIPCHIEITPGLAHWFPENLPDQLNKAIQFLMETE